MKVPTARKIRMAADLEAGRPEFELTERLDAEQVHGHQQHQRGDGGQLDGHVGEEELEVQADRDEFGDAGHGPVDEVHPSGQVRALFAEHFAGVADERARGLAVHDEFAQGAHQQVGDDAGDGVGEDQRRPGGGQTSAGSHEQADADCAAHRDHRDVTAAQGLLIALGAESRVDDGGLRRLALKLGGSTLGTTVPCGLGIGRGWTGESGTCNSALAPNGATTCTNSRKGSKLRSALP